MFFPALTLVTSLALAAVSGWFSIAGLVTIMAGYPAAALILGCVLEAGKLVTASWLYRNWQQAGWRLKLPLMYFMLALMLTTSMGVFGYLSKAHLEQGAGTIDNTAKIEELDRRIANEQRRIADNDRLVSQLDSSVDAFIAKNQTNRAVAVRRSQQAQRDQLNESTQQIQAEITRLNSEKFQLGSELRKLELEVGPIKYIAKLIYGTDDAGTLAAAVRIFMVLIVSTLDPLAITLLIAANFSLLNARRETPPAPEPVPASVAQHAPTTTVVPTKAPASISTPPTSAPHAPTTVADTYMPPCALAAFPDITEYHLERTTTPELGADLAEIIEDDTCAVDVPGYFDDTGPETPTPVSNTDAVAAIRTFLEQLQVPLSVAGVSTPKITQIGDQPAATASEPEPQSVIMSDTVRELRGRHVILTPLTPPAQDTKQHSQPAPNSWIATFKGLA